MRKLIDKLDLRGPPVGTIIEPRPKPKKPEGPNCALESDPVFGVILIIGLSIGVGGVTGGWGFFPFLIWALWMGLKPFEPLR